MDSYLYHYYERDRGPFENLSALALDEARDVLERIRRENDTMAAHRFEGYLARRGELEARARSIFIGKGGKPVKEYPHYFVVGACEWLQTWYKDAAWVRLRLSDIDPATVSFSYGDLFPTFSARVQDGKEYRSQVYTLDEIRTVVKRYGLPQLWNPDGALGPERYVEAHVWDDAPVRDSVQ